MRMQFLLRHRELAFPLFLATLLIAYGLLKPPWWAYVPLNLALAAGLVVLARRRGHDLDDLGISTGTLRRGAVIGFVAAAVVVAGLGIVSLLATSDPQGGQLLADRGDKSFLPGGILYELFVRIPLGTALFEAVAFRGVIFASVRRATSVRTAVIVSSVAFGLWHIGPTLQALRLTEHVDRLVDPFVIVVGTVVMTTVGGLLFCALRLVGRHLVASALTHWSINAVALLAAYTAAGGALPFGITL